MSFSLLHISYSPFFILYLSYLSFMSLSPPSGRSVASDMGDHSYPASPSHPSQQGAPPPAPSSAYSALEGKELLMAPNQTQSLDRPYRAPAAASAVPAGHKTLGRAQPPHGPPAADPTLNGPRQQVGKDYR